MIEPIARNGRLVLDEIDGFSEPIIVGISQIQLEMDSGKTIAGNNTTDLNRAGVAVLEFVSEPELT